jgi:hypothetical protein
MSTDSQDIAKLLHLDAECSAAYACLQQERQHAKEARLARLTRDEVRLMKAYHECLYRYIEHAKYMNKKPSTIAPIESQHANTIQ